MMNKRIFANIVLGTAFITGIYSMKEGHVNVGKYYQVFNQPEIQMGINIQNELRTISAYDLVNNPVTKIRYLKLEEDLKKYDKEVRFKAIREDLQKVEKYGVLGAMQTGIGSIVGGISLGLLFNQRKKR